MILSKVKKYKPATKFLAIDTEATGLFGHHGCRAFAVSTCDNNGVTNYWETPVDPLTRTPKWSKDVLTKIYKYVTSFNTLVFHNLNFDLFMLSLLPLPEWNSFPVEMENTFAYYDTLIRAHVIDSSDLLALKHQAKIYCDIADDDEKELDDCVKSLRRKSELKSMGWKLAAEGVTELAGQKNLFHKCDFWLPKAYAKHFGYPSNHPYNTICSTYAIKDAMRTALLFIRQEQTFEVNPNLLNAHDEQHRVIMPLYRMTKCGISIHKEHFPKAVDEASKVRNDLIDKMQSLLGNTDFNPNSQPQLSKALFTVLKFESVKMTDAGNDSTDKSVLPELKLQKKSKKALQFVDFMISYREVNAANGYLQSYRRFKTKKGTYETELLLPNIKQAGTSTTRLSSENPNGQNISKGKERIDENGNVISTYSIRKVFGPTKDRIWSSIDYDQLQLRIFAYWSKDPKLIKAFQDGFDFHTYMAMQIFETAEPTKIQRRVAKNVNFGYIFGAGEKKIDATCGIKGIFRRVQALFPCVTESINRTVSFVKQYGYVETMGGYRLYMYKSKAYAGVNYIVQGTEGEIVKTALTNCDRYLIDNRLLSFDYSNIVYKSKVALILQVHDELLFSLQKKLGRERVTKVLSDLASIMQEAGNYYGVPCVCKPEIIEDNWSEAMKLQDWRNN